MKKDNNWLRLKSSKAKKIKEDIEENLTFSELVFGFISILFYIIFSQFFLYSILNLVHFIRTGESVEQDWSIFITELVLSIILIVLIYASIPHLRNDMKEYFKSSFSFSELLNRFLWFSFFLSIITIIFSLFDSVAYFLFYDFSYIEPDLVDYILTSLFSLLLIGILYIIVKYELRD